MSGTTDGTAVTRTSRAARAAVVVVNYNTPGLVLDCLAALAGEARALGLRVTVVDNASPDGSLGRLRGAVSANDWGGWVEVLDAGRNGGFAAGNNVALRRLLADPAPPEYVLLLNPDTVPAPGAVGHLLAFLDASPAAGIAGSRLLAPDGTPQPSAFRFHGVASEFEGGVRLGLLSRLLARAVVAPPPRDEPHEADWVSGASLLVRRAVLEQVGLLDEGFFLYFEEVDFCRRARAAGWSCWHVPASRVVHLEGQATGLNGPRPARRVPGYWFAARRRYFLKHRGRLGTLAADCAWTLGRVLWKARRAVQGKPEQDPPHLLRDFVRFNFLTRHPRPAPEVVR